MKFKMNNHEWEILELPKEQIKLIYEKETNEETICNISANSLDIIHKIVEDYFKKAREVKMNG